MTVAVLAAATALLVFIARPAVSESPSPCTLPVTIGRCDAIIPRYAYYKDQNECREFMYGGCGGNANNFQTLSDCQVACLPNRNTREVVEETPDKPTDEAKSPVEAISNANGPAEPPADANVAAETTANANGPAEPPANANVPAETTANANGPAEPPADANVPAETTAANANGPAETTANVPVESATTANANSEVESPTNANDTSLRAESEVQLEVTEEKKCPARCPNEFYLSHYEELGCKAVYDDSDKCCPARYNCSSSGELSNDKCYYQGRTYNIGEDLPEDSTPPCLVQCSCRQGYVDKIASITCVSIECPELFMGPLTEPNCVRQYQPDTCCSTSKFCAEENSTLEAAEGVVKCVYKGKTYIEGQKFYPEEEPCMTCHCQAGFTGKLEAPHCTSARCNLELHYGNYLRRKCVPVYYEGSCCPIEWRCPDEFNTAANETVLTDKTAPSEDECVFGNLRIAKGASLPDDIAKDCVTCSCAIPPAPTCVKNYNKCAPREIDENPDENPDEIIY